MLASRFFHSDPKNTKVGSADLEPLVLAKMPEMEAGE